MVSYVVRVLYSKRTSAGLRGKVNVFQLLPFAGSFTLRVTFPVRYRRQLPYP